MKPSATYTPAPPPPPLPPPMEAIVTLTMTETQAKTLRAVFYKIGGNPKGPRGDIDQLATALDVAMPWFAVGAYVDKNINTQCAFRNAIYFNDRRAE